jgi:hypothetical protein
VFRNRSVVTPAESRPTRTPKIWPFGRMKIDHHSVSIYAKLGVRGRTEATAWAYRNGLATDPALDDGAKAAR